MNLKEDERINNAFLEWNKMKNKRLNKEITYEEYIEWKLNYSIENSRLLSAFFMDRKEK